MGLIITKLIKVSHCFEGIYYKLIHFGGILL
ncbi:hypothetical protein CLVI_13940 [Clostridium vincentii]|uniref:Uncharacterized protein n=1 Tax=Clostridium vincentii TaxID=52704 RepID=A0A2T0BGB2_9CLOT|nr:hypothetical protein CLVI_13940 [Clostridium vincentii]